MKNAWNNQVGMLGNMFLWLVANLKQGVIYFIKQGGGNHKTWVYAYVITQGICKKIIEVIFLGDDLINILSHSRPDDNTH